MSALERKGYFVLLGLSTAWMLLILLPGILSSLSLKVDLFFAIDRLFFSPICHQDAARSFVLSGKLLPVCQRCFGIYFSFWLVVLVYPLFFRKKSKDVSFPLLIVFLLPMVLDYGCDVAGIWKNDAYSRGISGAIAGVGLGLMIPRAWIQACTQVAHSFQFSFSKRKSFHG